MNVRNHRVVLTVVATVVLCASIIFLRSNPNQKATNGAGAQQANQSEGATDQTRLLKITDQLNDEILSELAREDPAADGWETESFSDLVQVQLNGIAESIREYSLTGKQLTFNDGLVHDSYSCTDLRPTESLRTCYDDGRVSVDRWEMSKGGELTTTSHDLRGSLESMLSPWTSGQPTELYVAFKVTGVAVESAGAQTRIGVQLSGVGERGIVQQNSKWLCEWIHEDQSQKPQLSGIRVESFEEVVYSSQEQHWLQDKTHAVLGKNTDFWDQFAPSLDDWLTRLDWRLGLDLVGPHGLAVGDVNGDGLDDLFVCEPGGLPNRLFVQQTDGTAKDVSASAGVDWQEPASSALLADFDNDGDQDLVVASGRRLIVCENNGSAVFHQRTILTTAGSVRSIAAADYDRDGRLDIYACCHFHHDNSIEGIGLALPMPYHDANNGPPNNLFAGRKDFSFEDVTHATGLDVNNRRFSFAAAWEDYDNDGDQDIYVANDFGRNNLYRNDQGQFVDVAARAGVEDMASGMSVSWGDVNQDGLLDLYVANMYSTAGSRITSQSQFRAEATTQERDIYRRFARGNSLFANNGDGTFSDISLESKTNMGRWAWGSLFADLNNDGRQDILSANGMITSVDDPSDL